MGRVTVFKLCGELDIASSGTLEDAVARADGTEVVVADLRLLDFIDSAGLSALINTDKRTRAQGREFILLEGVGQVERLLELTGVAGHLIVAESLDEILIGSSAAHAE